MNHSIGSCAAHTPHTHTHTCTHSHKPHSSNPFNGIGRFFLLPFTNFMRCSSSHDCLQLRCGCAQSDLHFVFSPPDTMLASKPLSRRVQQCCAKEDELPMPSSLQWRALRTILCSTQVRANRLGSPYSCACATVDMRIRTPMMKACWMGDACVGHAQIGSRVRHACLSSGDMDGSI
jgi:hypothetical protein